jgi:hypothetical protein
MAFTLHEVMPTFPWSRCNALLLTNSSNVAAFTGLEIELLLVRFKPAYYVWMLLRHKRFCISSQNSTPGFQVLCCALS